MIEYTFFWRCDGCGKETRGPILSTIRGAELNRPTPPYGWSSYPSPIGEHCPDCVPDLVRIVFPMPVII